VKALHAGTDIVMLCHNWSAIAPAVDAVAQAIEDESFDPAQWSRASKRIARLRQLLSSLDSPAPPVEIIGCTEHRALVAEARQLL